MIPANRRAFSFSNHDPTSQIQRRRTYPRHRAGLAKQAGADDGVDEYGLARGHAQDRFYELLEPFAAEILAQGRDQRPHATRRALVRRLRCRHAALRSRTNRWRLPHRLPELLLPGIRAGWDPAGGD